MNSGSSNDLLFELGIKPAKYAISPLYSNKEELLNSIINKIFVFVSAPDNGAKLQRIASCAQWMLPTRTSFCNFNHTSIIVETYDNALILIEYGAYNQYREGDYHGKVHYFDGSDGLRFIQMTPEDIDNVLNNEFNYLVSCNVQQHMKTKKLLESTKWQGSYHQWDKDNYNLVAQNCQLFVRKAIQVLGATRESEKQKNRVVMKCVIPFRVLNALEDNENDSERIIEKIPVAGQIYGLIKCMKKK